MFGLIGSFTAVPGKRRELATILLEGVGGMRLLNQADGIHPTAEGQKILAEHLWETLEDVLSE